MYFVQVESMTGIRTECENITVLETACCARDETSI